MAVVGFSGGGVIRVTISGLHTFLREKRYGELGYCQWEEYYLYARLAILTSVILSNPRVQWSM